MIHIHNMKRPVEKKKVCRKPRTYKFKAQVLRQLYEARLSEDSTPEEKLMTTIARKNGISKGMLSRYQKEASMYAVVEDETYWRRQRGLARTMNPKKLGIFETCNQALYYKFSYTRKVLGFPVDNFWLKNHMKKIVKEAEDEGIVAAKDAENFKASNRWLQNFLEKYRITSQRGTEKKPLHVSARSALIQSFHKSIMSIQRSKGKSEPDPKYGRFVPEAIWNTDQIPVNFQNESNRSYNAKNTNCWIRTKDSGKSKKFCTLQLTLRAAGEQLMPPLVIFKGIRPTDETKAELDAVTGVLWYFNAKAHANGFSSRYFLRQLKNILDEKEPAILEHLMVLDSYTAQKTDECIEFASENDIKSIFLPGGCTDILQPVDKHIGAWFKGKLKCKWQKFFFDQFNKDPNFTVSAQQKRVLILQWVSEIWQELILKEKEAQTIRTAFEQPGILLELDGTNKIKFEDFPLYKPDFVNVPEWED